MRFMLMVKATPMSESGAPPNSELRAAIGKYSEGLMKSGVMVGGGGLMPTVLGGRVNLAGGKIIVTDGPFAEIKEVVAGFAIVDVKSKAEAVRISKEFLQIHADVMGPDFEMDTELRQMFDVPPGT